MFTPLDVRRMAFTTAIAFALLAFAMSGAASARPIDDARTSSLAGTPAPRQDLRSPDARDAARADEIARDMKGFQAAQAQLSQLRYPANPTPKPQVEQPTSPSPAPSDDTPWLPIALSIGAVLAIVAVSTTQVHRLRRATA